MIIGQGVCFVALLNSHIFSFSNHTHIAMRYILAGTLFCIALFAIFSFNSSVSSEKKNTDPRVEELLAKMSLEEKIGQMTQINITKIITDSLAAAYDSATTLAIDTNKVIHYVTKYHVGSFLNGRAMSPDVWFRFTNQLQHVNMRNSKNKIPIIYGVDHVHGSSYLSNGTIFPHNINIACSFDTTFAYEEGWITATETADLYHRWIFAPVFDLGKNKYWGRYYETFGEDPYLISKMGTSYVRGLQGNTEIAPYKAAACAKHFLGYSDPKSGWDRSPAEISDQALREFYLPPFKAAVEAGVKTVMINSGEINGIPVHANYDILTKLLRNELGFEGIAVTDWMDIIALQKMHYVAENEKEATFLAISAGVDMAMVPLNTDFCDNLLGLVKEGRISEERINQSVRRILKVKFDIGLFDQPYPRNDRFNKIGSKEHKVKALKAAKESLVLMKNDQNLLPIKPGKKTILVVGETADKKIPLCGGWTYRFMAKSEYWFPKDMKTIYGALKDEFADSKVIYAKENEIKKLAPSADIIIAAAGEESAYAETDGSINDLELSESQVSLVKTAIATGKPVVLVLTEGRPRIISKIYDQCKSVIFAGLPGVEGAQAIAEILSGKTNPSGKLSFTYPYKQGHIIPYNHKQSEYSILRPVGEELKRFAICEFGQGLSYTKFSYAKINLSDTVISSSGKIKARVVVSNVGKIAGKESVLWFLTDEYGSITRPVKELKYFEKKELQPGQSIEFSFVIDPDKHLWFPDKEGKKLLEPGYFTLTVGDQKARFRLK